MNSARRLIAEFVANPSEGTATHLINWFRLNDSPDLIAGLASALALSGERLEFPGLRTADLASTGGPSSLTTLLCPLFLVMGGFCVPKLGIQGRPAGGIDVEAQIPGYNVDPASHQIHEIIRRCGYAHFLAGKRFAPLDQLLFRIRQHTNSQNVQSLVVSSILAKKLAVGVRSIALEIRVFEGGNFGSDFEQSKANAELFVKAAKLLSINARCILTDGTVPYQPYIGRLESLVALREFFSGRAETWLAGHASECLRYSAALIEDGRGLPPCAAESALSVFSAHIAAHGASFDAFERACARYETEPSTLVYAPRDGYPSFDLGNIRTWLVAKQSEENGTFPDPCGLTLLSDPSQKVLRGDPVMRVRGLNASIDGSQWFSIKDEPQIRRTSFLT